MDSRGDLNPCWIYNRFNTEQFIVGLFPISDLLHAELPNLVEDDEIHFIPVSVYNENNLDCATCEKMDTKTKLHLYVNKQEKHTFYFYTCPVCTSSQWRCVDRCYKIK